MADAVFIGEQCRIKQSADVLFRQRSMSGKPEN
jgi:hypothetical protein